METLLQWLSFEHAHNFFYSVLLIGVILLVRMVINRLIRNGKDILSAYQRAWISNVKNSSYLVIFLGLVAIWAAAIQTFLISIVAVAAAIVIATRELLLCISGSFYRVSSRPFAVGDWIEINGIRGEVIDRNLLSTTIQELYSKTNLYEYTGRRIVLPNSLLLSQPLRNETFFKNFVFHEMSLCFNPEAEVLPHVETLREMVNRHLEPHLEKGRRYKGMVQRRMSTEFMDVAPRIRVMFTEFANQIVNVTFYAPTGQAVAIEQGIVREFIAYLQREAAARADRKTQPAGPALAAEGLEAVGGIPIEAPLERGIRVETTPVRPGDRPAASVGRPAI